MWMAGGVRLMRLTHPKDPTLSIGCQVCRGCQSTEKGNPSSARQTLEEQIPNR